MLVGLWFRFVLLLSRSAALDFDCSRSWRRSHCNSPSVLGNLKQLLSPLPSSLHFNHSLPVPATGWMNSPPLPTSCYVAARYPFIRRRTPPEYLRRELQPRVQWRTDTNQACLRITQSAPLPRERSHDVNLPRQRSRNLRILTLHVGAGTTRNLI